MGEKGFFQALGTGVASLTFGVALSVFIFAVATGAVSGINAWLLFATSFLLMLRFWWRYTELFVQFLPSQSYWKFLFDFATSFFGILAIVFVGSMATWALLGAAAMATSAVRCCFSWKDASGNVLRSLKGTLWGSIGMLAVFAAIYLLAPLADQTVIAGGVLVIVLLFVAYSSGKK